MQKKSGSNVTKALGITLIVVSAIGILGMVAMHVVARAPLGPKVFISPGIMLLIGILMLRSGANDPEKLGDYWKSDDTKKTGKIIRTLDKAAKLYRKRRMDADAYFLNIGKNAPLEEVANAAFQRVSNPKSLSAYVREEFANAQRRVMALQYLSDDTELRDIAINNKETVALAALERIRDDKKIAEVAVSPKTSVAVAAVDRLRDTGELNRVANYITAPENARLRAFEKLGRPREIDMLRLRSAQVSPRERGEAAERLLNTGSESEVTQAARLVLGAKVNAESEAFVMEVARKYPRPMLNMCMGTWGEDKIKVEANEALGRHDEAIMVKLRSTKFTEAERRAAADELLQTASEEQAGKLMDRLLDGAPATSVHRFLLGAVEAYPGLIRTHGAKMLSTQVYPERSKLAAAILETGDEALIRDVAEKLLRGDPDPIRREFVLNAATAHPELIKTLWPKVREWGHTSTSKHTDYTKQAPHVDSTRYYDFFRYPDGRTVPNRAGRKSHTDGPLPSSDCADYGHTDSNIHTDNAESLKGYLGRFPRAVRGD